MPNPLESGREKMIKEEFEATGSLNIKPQVSVIIATTLFTNNNLDIMLSSTNLITAKHEIIIVTNLINEGVDIKCYLNNLLCRNHDLVKIKIIVVESELGATFARNLGATLAESSNLIFADDDVRLVEDVTPLLEDLENNICQGIQPMLLRLANPNIIDSSGDFLKKGYLCFYNPYSRDAGQQLKELQKNYFAEEIPSMRSAFMIVRKDAFLAVGGWDDAFFFNLDDVDLGWRMVAAGYKLCFIPTVRVFHRGGRTTDIAKKNERTLKLYLLNYSATHLKINSYLMWPCIFARFFRDLFDYELRMIKKGKVSSKEVPKDIITTNRLFIERVKMAIVHKNILQKRFHFKGKQKLQDMAKGKRFSYQQS